MRYLLGVAGILLATNSALPLAVGGVLLVSAVTWTWLQKRRLAAA